MARVQDVANFFINLAQEQAQCDLGDLMTNLRLQKLLYFAQGSYLARYGKSLFDEELRKWDHGPVVESICRKYKVNGREGFMLDESFDENAYTSEEMELLLDVAREYDKYSTGQLVGMTHERGTPWCYAEQNGVISKESIQSYFVKNASLKTFRDLMKKVDILIPKRDENGQAVIDRSAAEGWEAVHEG